MAGFLKLTDDEAISGSLRYFSLGNIQFTDNLGNDLALFRPREFSVDAGYSRKLSPKLSLGVALRYVNSNLAGNNTFSGQTYKAASAISGDVSIFHKGLKADSSGLNYGITLTNLGSKISYTNDASQKDYIPANLGLGIAYTKVMDAENKVTFALDINKWFQHHLPLAQHQAVQAPLKIQPTWLITVTRVLSTAGSNLLVMLQVVFLKK